MMWICTTEQFLSTAKATKSATSSYGKGDKERRIQIGNESVINILTEYNDAFDTERQACNNFFINQSGKALSDQSVRRMINKYTCLL